MTGDREEDSPNHTHRKPSGLAADGGERQAVCLSLLHTCGIVSDASVDRLEQGRGDQ